MKYIFSPNLLSVLRNALGVTVTVNVEDDAVCFQVPPNDNISILIDTILVLF